MTLPNKNMQWFIFLLLICGVACSHTGSKCCDYNQIFRGQWDDFYLRGLACIEQADFHQALTDFQASLERRPPSRQFDRRMVRTYGMHYMDYFPNREAGFIYYLQHQYEKALKYLERSIQSEPSAKAYYYRNQVLKKMQTSYSHPVLALSEPCVTTNNHCEIWQSSREIQIQGMAYDQQLIEKITIQDHPIFIGDGAKHIDFSKRLFLDEGNHDIRVQATNIGGTIIQKQIILHVDQTGPSISIEKSTQPDTINIYAQDVSEQLELSIDQKQILSVNKPILRYSLKWPSDKSEFFVCVSDRCKNQTCANVDHSQLFHEPQLSGLIAENKIIFQPDVDLAKIHAISDSITIVFDQGDPITIFDTQIRISGKISASRPIASVMINDTQIPIQACKHIYFSRRICLDVGQNKAYVLAKTFSGYCQRAVIQVYRKIPSVLKLENRYGLSLHPFNVNGKEQDNWGNSLLKFTDETEQANFELAGSFERNFLKALHEKHRFRINYRGQSERKETGSIPFQGSLLGDAYVSKYGLEISARIIDNRTSAVLGIKDVYRENKGNIEIQKMAKELSEKIHQSFPLIRGKIISKIENGYRFESKDISPNVSWPILVYKKPSDSDTIITGNGSITPGNHLNRPGMIVMDDGKVQCGDWMISR